MDSSCENFLDDLAWPWHSLRAAASSVSSLGSWGLFCHGFCWLKNTKVSTTPYDDIWCSDHYSWWNTWMYDLMVLRILMDIVFHIPQNWRPQDLLWESFGFASLCCFKKTKHHEQQHPQMRSLAGFLPSFWGWWRWYSPYCQSCHIFLRSASTWSFWWDFSTPLTLSSQVLGILRLQVLGSKPWVDQSPVMHPWCFVVSLVRAM